jgi:thiosulfate/3-mercaptopyruvate sulfurtransferase
MKSRQYLLVLFAVLIAGCGSQNDGQTNTTAAEEVKSAILVDADWVESNAQRPDVVIIDIAENEAAYLDGHIPSAHFLNWRTDISDPAQMENFNVLSQDRFEELMSRFGAKNNSTVVLYDDASSRLAARVYWTMKYYGHESLRIVDGGRNAWQYSGREYVSDPPSVEASQYRVQGINDRYIADMEYINSQLRDPGFTLVDARAEAQYTGDVAGRVFSSGIEHRNMGHVYGAQNIPWSENFNEDGTFKSRNELLALYEPHGVGSEKSVVTYCNVGIQGSSPWFVLSELLGYQDVRLYDASMAEYANNDENIMVTGKHCM